MKFRQQWPLTMKYNKSKQYSSTLGSSETPSIKKTHAPYRKRSINLQCKSNDLNPHDMSPHCRGPPNKPQKLSFYMFKKSS